jgi:hypothetical protein
MTEEFQNIGLVMYSPDSGFLKSKFCNKYGRLSKCFAGVDGEHFKRNISRISERFTKLGSRYRDELKIEEHPKTVRELTEKVLALDDSSLQFSKEGFGVTDDLDVAFDKLYSRYVERYLEKHERSTRNDDDVWRDVYRSAFEKIHATRSLRPIKIKSDNDEYEFEHFFQNGRPHIFQTVSLDMAEAKSMQNKAHLWLGLGHSLLNPKENKYAPDQLKLHLMLGEPKEAKLKKSFETAKSILMKIPCDLELVSENEVDEFAKNIEKLFKTHNG